MGKRRNVNAAYLRVQWRKLREKTLVTMRAHRRLILALTLKSTHW